MISRIKSNNKFTNCAVKTLLLVVMLAVFPIGLLKADSEIFVSSEQWARTQSVSSFMKTAGLKEIIQKIDSKNSMVLSIQYPGGEGGQLWAQQFRNRLVALGIAGNRVKLMQGVSRDNHLRISIGESR